MADVRASSTAALRRSPLADRHRALGARMAPFAGWEMPIDYGSVLSEHQAVRTWAGAFDLSHLGALRVTGAGAAGTVQATFTNDVTTLGVGQAQYTLCLNSAGGIVDDLLVYRLPWGYFAVPNAANTAVVRAALSQAAGESAQVMDCTDALACIAVQGPDSASCLLQLGIPVEGLDYLQCRSVPGPDGDDLPPAAGLVARSGYTGEHGYELFVPAVEAGEIWDAVLGAGAVPAGLGARDTLRLEMGYPLHGSDLTPDHTPIEARLGWAVKLGTGFRGEEAYRAARAQGVSRMLSGVRATGRGVLRSGCVVTHAGRPVGALTSGSFSPTLRTGIGLGYLDTAVEVGDEVDVMVRDRAVPAAVVRPPFVQARTRAT